MATIEDIDSEFTLDIDGEVSPEIMVELINDYNKLLKTAYKQFGTLDKPKFRLQVKQGSSLLSFTTINTEHDHEVINKIFDGFNHLNSGSNLPEIFSKELVHRFQVIKENCKKKKYSKISQRVWINKKLIELSKNQNLTKEFHSNKIEKKNFGSVIGFLQELNSHSDDQKTKKFAIYNSIYPKKITAITRDLDLFNRAYENFDKRVEVLGQIKFNPLGIPIEVIVHNFEVIPEIPSEDYNSAKGILKGYDQKSLY